MVSQNRVCINKYTFLFKILLFQLKMSGWSLVDGLLWWRLGRKSLRLYLISTKFREVSGKGSLCTHTHTHNCPALNLIPFKVVSRHPAADAYMAQIMHLWNYFWRLMHTLTHTLSFPLSSVICHTSCTVLVMTICYHSFLHERLADGRNLFSSGYL